MKGNLYMGRYMGRPAHGIFPRRSVLAVPLILQVHKETVSGKPGHAATKQSTTAFMIDETRALPRKRSGACRALQSIAAGL